MRKRAYKAAWARKYYAAHREQMKARSQRWRVEHPERVAAASRKWRAAHPLTQKQKARKAALARKWRAANHDALCAYDREYSRVNLARRRPYMQTWRRARIAARQALLYEGKRCMDCGSKKLLHYHHRNPKTKLFNVSKWLLSALAVLRREIKKCDLVCAPCHRRRHNTNRLTRRAA